MTYSILNDCLLLRNEPVEKLQNYFKAINVTIFGAIFNKYSSSQHEAKQAILFILCAYSEESPMVVIRQDNKTEMDNICEYLQIPEYFRPRLYDLSDTEVRTATTQYLTQFSGPLFRAYKFLLIRMADLELDIVNRNFGEKKGDTEEGEPTLFYWDLKEQQKAEANMIRLANELAKIESQIKNEIKRHEGIEGLIEFKIKKGKSRATGRGVSLEHSGEIE